MTEIKCHFRGILIEGKIGGSQQAVRVGGCVLSFVSRLLRSAFSNLASAELDSANGGMPRENVLWIQVIKVFFFSFEILYLKICVVLYARLNNPTNGANAKPSG